MRIARHAQLYDIICGGLITASVPAELEPNRLICVWNIPEGMSSVPWKMGRPPVGTRRNVRLYDDIATSHLSSTVHYGSAAAASDIQIFFIHAIKCNCIYT